MLLEKIDKMVEVQNLLLDRFPIRNGSEGLAPVTLQEASPCAYCSRLDHVEMDCPIVADQGQGMYRQGQLTRRDREVINFTRSRIKNISELTNLMKMYRIEGYNGK